MKYQIKYSDIEDTSEVMDLNKLAKVCLELAQESDFEMVAGEGNEWSRDIQNGMKTEIGFYMGEWKDDVTDENKLETCKSILSTFGDIILEIKKEEK